MTNFVLGLSAATLIVGACGTSPEENPPWLIRLIEAQLAEPVANPPAYIARREYASGEFYFLPSRCCDVFSELYDAEGTLVCNPDGGITGDGSGDCPALGDMISEEIVWRDPRG